MADDGLDQKHLGQEGRRRRWDPAARYGGYGGKTVVRPMETGSIGVEGYSDIFLKVSRPQDEDGNVLVSELDTEMQELLQASGAEGNELETGGYWFRLPQLLEQACVSRSEARDKGCANVIVTTYAVPGVSWMVPNAEERRRLQQRREGRLTLAHEDGKRVFCRLPEGPLERIPDRTLLDAHTRLVASDAGPECNPRQAKVLREDASSCWCAPVSQGRRASDAHLEVDLGANCQVTWVSTQGRFPPLSRTDKETGIRQIHQGHPSFNNWVARYELSYRVHSGHEWIVLGELKGNCDMTTEVAHELAQVAKEPLQCRYLRFRPLEYQGLPAMRVGVYGQRLDGAEEARSEEDVPVIRYSICRVKEQANLRWAPAGMSRVRAGCLRCGRSRGGTCREGCATKSMGAQRRVRMRKGFLEEVQRLGGTQTLGSQRKVSASAWDGWSRDEEAGDIWGREGEVPPPPAPPSLGRQRSFSDPLLSRASSSAGDSYVLAEALSSADSDDWLIV